MGRHSASAAFCGVNDELQLLQGKRRSGCASRTPAIVGVNLDPIRALSDLIPNHSNQVLAIGFFGAYTTFSTYANESVALLRAGDWIGTLGNILGTNLLCNLGALLGLAVGSRF